MYFEDDDHLIFDYHGHARDQDDLDDYSSFLEDTFWWLTHEERRTVLPKMKGYPERDPSNENLAKFEAAVRPNYTRYVECKLNLGFITMPVHFDIVSGDLFLIEDGRYRFAGEFVGMFSIDVPGVPGAGLHLIDIFRGSVRDYSLYHSRASEVMEALAKVGKLPMLGAR